MLPFKLFSSVLSTNNKKQKNYKNSTINPGTKCVDPNTGLIYFKYDFGYEFGILFPGEGHKFVANKWNSAHSPQPLTSTTQQLNKTPLKTPYPLPGGHDLVIPVRHESSSTCTPNHNYGSQTFKRGYSSDTEATKYPKRPMGKTTSPNTFNKRYSLPNAQIIDINIDRLHSNDSLKSFQRLSYPGAFMNSVGKRCCLLRTLPFMFV